MQNDTIDLHKIYMDDVFYKMVLHTINDTNKRLMWLKSKTRKSRLRTRRAGRLLDIQRFLWQLAGVMKNDRIPLRLEGEFI